MSQVRFVSLLHSTFARDSTSIPFGTPHECGNENTGNVLLAQRSRRRYAATMKGREAEFMNDVEETNNKSQLPGGTIHKWDRIKSEGTDGQKFVPYNIHIQIKRELLHRRYQ